MLGLLVEVEGQGFEKRVSTYLPILIDCLSLYDPYSTEEEFKETANTKPGSLSLDNEDSTAEDGEPAHVAAIKDDLEEEGVSDGEAEMDVTVEEDTEEEEKEEITRELTGVAAMAALDYLLFTTLSSIHKLVVHCSVLRVSSFASHMTVMWGK